MRALGFGVSKEETDAVFDQLESNKLWHTSQQKTALQVARENKAANPAPATSAPAASAPATSATSKPATPAPTTPPTRGGVDGPLTLGRPSDAADDLDEPEWLREASSTLQGGAQHCGSKHRGGQHHAVALANGKDHAWNWLVAPIASSTDFVVNAPMTAVRSFGKLWSLTQGSDEHAFTP